MQSTAPGDHIIVAQPAAGGRIEGYAYSAPFGPRPAYRFTRETSVYLAAQAAGKGLGARMYDDLPDPGSEKPHLKMGFENIGVMKEAGKELGEWRDAGWFQLML